MKKQPVYAFAKWQVKEGELANVLALLPRLIEKSSEEKGNLFYKIHQTYSDTHTLVLWEGYEDDAALELHRNTAHFKEIVLDGIVPLLDSREVVLASEILND